MSFDLACPRCKAQLTASDEIEGKRIKCKTCGEAFVARPFDEEASSPERSREAAPRRKPAGIRRSSDDDDEEEPRSRQKSGSAVPLILLLVVGGFVLVGGGVAGLYFFAAAKPAVENQPEPQARIALGKNPVVAPPVAAVRPYNRIFSLALSGDGKRVAAAGHTREVVGGRERNAAEGIRVWMPETGSQADSKAYEAPASRSQKDRVALSPDGSIVGALALDRVLFWKVDTGELISSAKLEVFGAAGVATTPHRFRFNEDGSAVVFISNDALVTVRVQGGVVTVNKPKDKPGSNAYYVPGLKRIAEVRKTADIYGCELATWDPASDGPPTVVRLEGIKDIPGAWAVSGNGKVVAVSPYMTNDKDKTQVSLFDPSDGKRISLLPLDDHADFRGYKFLELSMDARVLVGRGTDNGLPSKFMSIDVIQLANTKRTYRAVRDPFKVLGTHNEIVLSSDGTVLIYDGAEGKIIRVDTRTGNEK